MLLISYGSVAGWFRVWSVCVKAQLHVQSSPPPHTPPLTHLLHASLCVSSTIGSLFGDGRGLWEARGALMKNRKCESAREVAPTRALIQSKSQLLSLQRWL